MKLTNRTTPQAKNYQCDKCKAIKCHKDMYDDNICYECYNKKSKDYCKYLKFYMEKEIE